MRGHLHTDIISIVVLTIGVFATAHALRIGAAKLGTSNQPIIASIGQGVGGFLSLP